TTDLAGGVRDAELIVVCTPVESIAEHVREVLRACPPTALITDAGSTKQAIVSAVDEVCSRHDGRCAAFVGSHPMAGGEKNGPQHARSDLFTGCVTIVTPTPATAPKGVQQISRFWKSLGAKVVRMQPDEHDQAVASISHLPHVVASALSAAT